MLNRTVVISHKKQSFSIHSVVIELVFLSLLLRLVQNEKLPNSVSFSLSATRERVRERFHTFSLSLYAIFQINCFVKLHIFRGMKKKDEEPS